MYIGKVPAYHVEPGEPLEVTVSRALSPDRRYRVLIQLPDGFALIAPDDARGIAAALLEVADEVDRG